MRISDWSSDVCSSDLPVAPFRFPGDQADDLAIVAQRQADEVGAEASEDLPRAIGIAGKGPEVAFDISVVAKQEDRHRPAVAADELLLIDFGQQARHHLAE